MMEPSTEIFSLEANQDYINIKDFQEAEGISKKLFNKLYRAGKIFLNDKVVDKRDRINKRDLITLVMDEEEEVEIEKIKMDLKIIYEDIDLLVIDKPAFLPVHNTRYHQRNTLSNGLAYYYHERNIRKKIRIVNRLDKNTSGLLIIAKSQHVDHVLSNQFRERSVGKKYIALVEGHLVEKRASIDVGIIDGEGSRKKAGAVGKRAITHYKVLEEFKDKSLLELEIPTGRSHQIRVHLSHIGHPIVGDSLYGSRIELPRHFLHSSYLSIVHPRYKRRLEFTSNIPEDLERIIYEI